MKLEEVELKGWLTSPNPVTPAEFHWLYKCNGKHYTPALDEHGVQLTKTVWVKND